MTTRMTPHMAARIEADLPITDAHRRAAFDSMAWPGWTYEQALRFDMRRRLIEARASKLRNREWQALQTATA
jgi:hypothetical protein